MASRTVSEAPGPLDNQVVEPPNAGDLAPDLYRPNRLDQDFMLSWSPQPNDLGR